MLRTGRMRVATIAVWALLALVGMAVSGPLLASMRTTDEHLAAHESVVGARLIASAIPDNYDIEAIADGVPASDPLLGLAVAGLRAELQAIRGVLRVQDPWQHGPSLGAFTSGDGRAIRVVVSLAAGLSRQEADETKALVRARIQAALTAYPQMVLRLGGEDLANDAAAVQTAADTRLGELIALPLTLLLMVFIFRGVHAAAIPVAASCATIGGGMAGLYLLTSWRTLDPAMLSVATVMGLGLAIDYSLLQVTRFREELARGLSAQAAVRVTRRTAGRAITFSALIVAASLGGLLVFPSPLYRMIAFAAIIVLGLGLLAGLTLTPVLLVVFASRIAAAPPEPGDGFFGRLARMIRRAPLVVALGAAVVLAAPGLPLMGLKLVNASPAELLPAAAEEHAYHRMLQRFPGTNQDTVVVVAAADPVTLGQWVNRADVVALDRRHSAAAVDTPDPARYVRELREHRPAFPLWVTGHAAIEADLEAEVRDHLLPAGALIVLSTLLLLFWMTRSLVIPVKAVVMNVLSLGACFGALVFFFQGGDTGIQVWVPVAIFAFVFGLSMDYEVFLLARVKELHDAGHTCDRSVEIGLQRTGKVITHAAVLMLIVFTAFTAGQMLTVKQVGTALMVAVIVDVTLVRCLLVPATMNLLGEYNWWVPWRRTSGQVRARVPAPQGEPATPRQLSGPVQ